MNNAITIKDISGTCIGFIPKGTKFCVKLPVTNKLHYSHCSGLPITSIYNDEFELMTDEEIEE